MPSSPKRSAATLVVGVVALGALAAGAVSLALYTAARSESEAGSDASRAASATAADADALARERMPPADENAWTLLRTLAPGALGFGAASLTLESGAPPGPEELARADAAAASLAIGPEAIATLDAALARPRLVVDCSFELRGRCPQLTVQHALDAAALLALRDAGGGDAVAGIARMSRALRLAGDRIRSARTLLELGIATREARRLIAGAALVAARVQARGDEATGPAVAAALAAMGEDVEALVGLDWSPDRALVGEALSLRALIHHAAGGAARAAEGSDEWALSYIDAMRAYARDPEHASPPPLPDPDRWGTGHDPFHVAATVPDHAPTVADLRTSHTEAARDASIAARAIESARAEALRIP